MAESASSSQGCRIILARELVAGMCDPDTGEREADFSLPGRVCGKIACTATVGVKNNSVSRIGNCAEQTLDFSEQML